MKPALYKFLNSYPQLEACLAAIEAAYALLYTSYSCGGKVLLCGNGGSAADCEHIVGELMKGYQSTRPVPMEIRGKLTCLYPETGDYLADHLQGALPAISLVSQTTLLTALVNDVPPDMIFAQQVYGYGREHDALIAISTSGDSANVVNAVQVARAIGLQTLGFTGADGGKLKSLCDVTVCVPYRQTAAVQERCLPIYHVLCEMLEDTLFPTRIVSQH